MKRLLFLILLIICPASQIFAQSPKTDSRIDLMLLNGEYRKAIDTCRLILSGDSLNAGIHYKMGIAFQSIMNDDSSFISFLKAASIDPDNKVYSYSLAKGYYSYGKNKPAEALFQKLAKDDSLNWPYAFYLSSIYMQSNRYDNALNVYDRFLKKDSTNNVYLDKAAYAYLKKGDYQNSIDLYQKSLAVKKNNITAIKNLSYLYALTLTTDTAIQLLTTGIQIDSTDIDLRIKRAQLYYILHYTKRALDDYLVVLASGDSSKLYLKRVGIGYCYNLQPRLAIEYLLKAYNADSSDYETCSYLGQSYFKIKDTKNSVYYFKKSVGVLAPFENQMRLTLELCGEAQKANRDYSDAIESYLRAYTIGNDPGLYMIIANIYDEKLNNKNVAITYYQRFLTAAKSSKRKFDSEYLESVEKRMNFLKEHLNDKQKVTFK